MAKKRARRVPDVDKAGYVGIGKDGQPVIAMKTFKKGNKLSANVSKNRAIKRHLIQEFEAALMEALARWSKKVDGDLADGIVKWLEDSKANPKIDAIMQMLFTLRVKTTPEAVSQEAIEQAGAGAARVIYTGMPAVAAALPPRQIEGDVVDVKALPVKEESEKAGTVEAKKAPWAGDLAEGDDLSGFDDPGESGVVDEQSEGKE